MPSVRKKYCWVWMNHWKPARESSLPFSFSPLFSLFCTISVLTSIPANPPLLSLRPPSHNPRDHWLPDIAGLLCSDRFSNAAVKYVRSGTPLTPSFCGVMERLSVISAGLSSRLQNEEAGRCSPYGWHTCGSPPWGIYYESCDLHTV